MALLNSKINPIKYPKDTESKKENKNESLCDEVSELVTCLMNASISLHKLHLKVTGQGSFAAHMALKIYEVFHDASDDLAEHFQGAYGELLKYKEVVPTTLNSPKEAISFLEDLKTEISDLQKILPYSEIINDLDIVKSEINGAKYKLTFLQ